MSADIEVDHDIPLRTIAPSSVEIHPNTRDCQTAQVYHAFGQYCMAMTTAHARRRRHVKQRGTKSIRDSSLGVMVSRQSVRVLPCSAQINIWFIVKVSE